MVSSDPVAKVRGKNGIVRGDLLHGRYRIGRVIGTGAYGEIFGATDEQTGEQVAIKALPPGARTGNDTARGRFHREMMVIRNLNHPNIIAIYDWGETEQRAVFMVLEYIEGQTLDRVVRNRPLAPEVAIDVARQITQALQIAHAHGVIHRDLKPANIMLSEKTEGGYGVKVLDFGMAKLLSRMEDESIVELTREGIAVGTPRYIAPEQARGLPVGPTADLYALGLLFYEVLTGVQAVKADSVELAVRAHVSAAPLELAEIDQVPEVIRPLLRKLLEKKVEDRYQDAGVVLAAFDSVERALRGEGAVVRRPCQDHGQAKVQGHVARAGSFAWPQAGREVGEAVAGVLLLPLVFWLVAAQFPDHGGVTRLLFGMTVPFIAIILAFVLDSGNWNFSVWRLLLAFNVLATGLLWAL